MNSLEKYSEKLKEIENNFNNYSQELENIIDKVTSSIAHTVITKGEIVNPTPYYLERMGVGLKANGKVIPFPIASDDCMKYHYDNKGRIVMIEQCIGFLKEFRITEIYFYNELTERLRFSSGDLAVLTVFDNAFSNTQLALTFAGCNGYSIEEFIYDKDILMEIKESDSKDALNYETQVYKFMYNGQKLTQIERVCQNGFKELVYTTKKPDFNKIKEDTYNSLKKLILNYKDNFASIGIEGFVDQSQPMLCVCFTEDRQPDDLIADWNTEMYDVWLYDYQFNDSQERKCVKIIAEMIVKLVEEGLLKDKQIYFHQSQICVTQFYSGARSVFKKANIDVM